MAQTVKLKRSNTAGTIPTTSNLALGEVAINTKDGKFFLRKHVDGSTGDAIHAYAPQGINAYGTQELVVKVVTKTTAHPNHGSGSSSGYTVQGLEGPFLALIPGNTYKFDVSDSTNSGHPFRFYLDAAKATAYTTGVTTSGSAGNSGAYVQIAVTTSTPQVLYYQCSAHSLMGSAAYVASDAIAANAVGTSQIAQNSITSSEIPDNSIGATQISAAVLAAKQDNLGNNSITAAMISQNTVGISELNVSDGSNGQVLTTNGSGTLSFANQSAGTVTETFKTVSVSGQDDVVADGATDTLTLAAGSGMTITTNASSDTITFVSSASGIADDAVTTSKIADLNVTSAKLANNSVTAAKIATDAVGASEIAANSVGISELNVSDGSNGQVLTTNGSGTLSFATASGSVSEAFKTLSVSGQDDVVADSATDTLTFAAGSNMTITTNASNDTITFASSGSGGSSSSFAKNTFSGDGSTTAFTLTTSMSNENGLIVFIDGVYQADNVYSVSGTTLTFATAPVNGRVIEVFQLEGGIVGTAPILATMTGDGSDTTLALGTTPSSENQCFVTIDGVMQHKSTYSVSGSTLTFSTAPPNGTAVEAITLTNTSVATFQDSDGDTKIQMEESSDEDKIRFDTGGTERMIIDSTGVGIGTSSPAVAFHMTGNGFKARFDRTGSAGSVIEYANGGNVVGNLGVQSGGFGFGGGFRDPDLFITTGGQIVAGGTNADPLGLVFTGKGLSINEDSGTAFMQIDSGNGSRIDFGVGGSRNTTIYADANVTELGRTTNHPIVFKTNNTERVRIANDGKVGIGTSSPSVPLDILTNLSSDTTSSPDTVLTLATKYASTGTNGVAGAGPRLEFKIPDDETNPITGAAIAGLKENADDSVANAALAFYTSQDDTTLDEAMRIASDGKVFIATTTAARTTDGHEFHTDGFARHTVDGDKSLELVRRTSFGEMAEFFKDTSLIGVIGAYTTGRLYIGSGDTGITFASDYESIYPVNTTTRSARDDAVSLGYISGGRFDDIVATNGTIQTSDQKEKNTIIDSDLGLDFIKKLSPKSYKFNGKTRTHYGLIAQDVETVLSDISKPATDFAGFIKSDISEEQDGSIYRYGLRYNEFISPLIKAIQEQQVIIDDLKARIETLEG